MCVGAWSLLGYVKDGDIKAVTILPEVEGLEERLEENWDRIITYFDCMPNIQETR
jgi:hypothetical protein